MLCELFEFEVSSLTSDFLREWSAVQGWWYFSQQLQTRRWTFSVIVYYFIDISNINDQYIHDFIYVRIPSDDQTWSRGLLRPDSSKAFHLTRTILPYHPRSLNRFKQGLPNDPTNAVRLLLVKWDNLEHLLLMINQIMSVCVIDLDKQLTL